MGKAQFLKRRWECYRNPGPSWALGWQDDWEYKTQVRVGDQGSGCFTFLSRYVNQSVFSSLKSWGCARWPLSIIQFQPPETVSQRRPIAIGYLLLTFGCHAVWVCGGSKEFFSSWQSSSLDETALFPCYSGQRGSWPFSLGKSCDTFGCFSKTHSRKDASYSSWWVCPAAIFSGAQKSTDSPPGQDLRELEKRWREVINT